MKALARSVVYWPNIDKDIEKLCHNCKEYVLVQKERARVNTFPGKHIIYQGTFYGTIVLAIDNYSVFFVSPTSELGKLLESIFARYG